LGRRCSTRSEVYVTLLTHRRAQLKFRSSLWVAEQNSMAWAPWLCRCSGCALCVLLRSLGIMTSDEMYWERLDRPIQASPVLKLYPFLDFYKHISLLTVRLVLRVQISFKSASWTL
jgi:hypothetical protein